MRLSIKKWGNVTDMQIVAIRKFIKKEDSGYIVRDFGKRKIYQFSDIDDAEKNVALMLLKQIKSSELSTIQFLQKGKLSLIQKLKLQILKIL